VGQPEQPQNRPVGLPEPRHPRWRRSRRREALVPASRVDPRCRCLDRLRAGLAGGGFAAHRRSRTWLPIVIPAGALARAWRSGRKQARLARLLRVGVNGEKGAPKVEPLDYLLARQAGELYAATGMSDVVDASVVLVARKHGHTVVTSDPGDLGRLDPELQLIVI
jgi:hypothetical protein